MVLYVLSLYIGYGEAEELGPFFPTLTNQFLVMIFSSRFMCISCELVSKIPTVQVTWVLHFWRKICRYWLTTH
ncbi:hypothetical protein POTOM_027198 [Populus tomentosa]|uniref:Uncharacterized protein n=1 Tax=Populus tomentosa TaxID=118781 RepID=A0A8X7ZI76_POPTO|nr:hypothetical protein POTOM_027198 [Populus tomentosa]